MIGLASIPEAKWVEKCVTIAFTKAKRLEFERACKCPAVLELYSHCTESGIEGCSKNC